MADQMFWRQKFILMSNSQSSWLDQDQSLHCMANTAQRSPNLVPLQHELCSSNIRSETSSNCTVYTKLKVYNYYCQRSALHKRLKIMVKSHLFRKTQREWQVLCRWESDISIQSIQECEENLWMCSVVGKNLEFAALPNEPINPRFQKSACWVGTVVLFQQEWLVADILPSFILLWTVANDTHKLK